ncbi:MAG: ferritin-like domain-containing protein [Chloroflexota bacterium]|nr:ferritin-like domain-containing protein [Chloroflexota bacterium]
MSSDTTQNLLASIQEHHTRRNFLKGAAAAGLAATGAGALAKGAHAQGLNGAPDSTRYIFAVATTAEQLAITFYTHGVNGSLGLSSIDLDELRAALIEEQIHHDFFVTNGGYPLASTFSFPQGAATFTDINLFIQTQQMLEGAFDSAFIAAVEEFAIMGASDLARISCQIAMIESEHRTLGRAILSHAGNSDYSPADNWAFAPKLVATVGDAVGVLAASGYLSPVPGNSYDYVPANFGAPDLARVYAKLTNTTPVSVGPA